MDQVEGIAQLGSMKAAPEEYWNSWESADAVNVPSTHVTVAVLKSEARIQADFKVARSAATG